MESIYANDIVKELNEINDALLGKTVVNSHQHANPISSALAKIKTNVENASENNLVKLYIGWDESVNAEYITKENIDSIVLNKPHIIVVNVDGGGEYTGIGVCIIDEDFIMMRYTTAVYMTEDSIGYNIPLIYAEEDNSVITSIYVCTSVYQDSSSYPPIIKPDIYEYSYNSNKQRYELIIE